jgi:hypothetical protein
MRSLLFKAHNNLRAGVLHRSAAQINQGATKQVTAKGARVQHKPSKNIGRIHSKVKLILTHAQKFGEAAVLLLTI